MKKMKLILAMLTVMIATTTFGQTAKEQTAERTGKKEYSEERKQKMEALKRAYITEQLDLTVAEAEKFWPIYNANDKQKTELRKGIREQYKSLKEDNKSEKDAVAAIDAITQKRKEEADLNAKFIKDCIPVLGVSKAVKLSQMERDFQHKLMTKMKDRKGGGKGKYHQKDGDKKAPAPQKK